MKILLFGANGQLGHDIQKELYKHDFITFSTNDFDFLSETKFSFSGDVDIVVNCMAMTDTSLCEIETTFAYKLNSERVGEIAEFCSGKDIPLFHFSTDYVFDGREKRAYEESDLPNPLNVYGASKLAGEEKALEKHKKVFIFRVSSLYGINGKNFIMTILEKASEENELTLVNDQFMSPTHSLDVARVVKHFVDNKITDYGIYHASNNGVCSWAEFTKEILNLRGLNNSIKEISYKDFPTDVQRPEYGELSIKKLEKYYQMPTWQESLSEFMGLLKEKTGEPKGVQK